jgi:HAD superfamily hydrolase (TIGR01484 family)
MNSRLQPLRDIDRTALSLVDYLLFDVDETFTTRGLMRHDTYAMLFTLREAGITAIPVTGRPSGWGNVMLTTWPIKACVTENGGVIAWRDAEGIARQHIVREAHRDLAYIVALRALGMRIVNRFPQVRISADQPYRLTDLAIDYAEESKNVSQQTINEVVAMMREAGYVTVVSSIHIHAYFPANEKTDGVYPLMQTAFVMDKNEVHVRAAFIGDSPNDAPLFAALPLSVGVANVRHALSQIPTPPAYVCEAECGAGFIEFATELLAARAPRR